MGDLCIIHQHDECIRHYGHCKAVMCDLSDITMGDYCEFERDTDEEIIVTLTDKGRAALKGGS